MESCIGSRMLRSTGLVAGSSGGQHIRSNPGRQRCGSHLPFLPAGGRGGVLLQEGPLEPHLGGFLPSGLTLLQSHSDRKLQAADNRRPPTTSNRLSVSPRIRGHLTEVQCAEHSESRPCPLSDLASLQDPCSCSNPAKPANCVENVSPVKPQRPHTRRSLLAAGALLFSTATFLKHPSQSQAGSIVVSSVPSPKVLELLDQASEAWGRGLDPTSQNRWAALAEACTLFDKLVALEPERTEWREARGQVGLMSMTMQINNRNSFEVLSLHLRSFGSPKRHIGGAVQGKILSSMGLISQSNNHCYRYCFNTFLTVERLICSLG